MRTRRLALVLTVLALFLAPAAGFACDGAKDAQAATATSCTGDCEHGVESMAEGAKLAQAAEDGCQASMNALIALAKKSDDDHVVALATRAEGGCEHSKAALIALAKNWTGESQPTETASPTTAQLADWAAGGCQKSAAALIAKAKASGNKTAADLAVKAESGNEKSKAALIAMVKENGGTF